VSEGAPQQGTAGNQISDIYSGTGKKSAIIHFYQFNILALSKTGGFFF